VVAFWWFVCIKIACWGDASVPSLPAHPQCWLIRSVMAGARFQEPNLLRIVKTPFLKGNDDTMLGVCQHPAQPTECLIYRKSGVNSLFSIIFSTFVVRKKEIK